MTVLQEKGREKEGGHEFSFVSIVDRADQICEEYLEEF